jgi:hypothetical protein
MTSFEALAKRMGSAGNSELLIVSFDIGTTQCMYSFSFSHEFETADRYNLWFVCVVGSWSRTGLHRTRGERKVNGESSFTIDLYVPSQANGHHHSIAPVVIEKLPGQTPGRAKVPSVLLYSKGWVTGTCSNLC